MCEIIFGLLLCAHEPFIPWLSFNLSLLLLLLLLLLVRHSTYLTILNIQNVTAALQKHWCSFFLTYNGMVIVIMKWYYLIAFVNVEIVLKYIKHIDSIHTKPTVHRLMRSLLFVSPKTSKHATKVLGDNIVRCGLKWIITMSVKIIECLQKKWSSIPILKLRWVFHNACDLLRAISYHFN